MVLCFTAMSKYSFAKSKYFQEKKTFSNHIYMKFTAKLISKAFCKNQVQLSIVTIPLIIKF